MAETPWARFARWWSEERGWRCHVCGGKLSERGTVYCSADCQTAAAV